MQINYFVEKNLKKLLSAYLPNEPKSYCPKCKWAKYAGGNKWTCPRVGCKHIVTK